MAKTVRKGRYADELDRTTIGVFLRLTENQVKALEQLAGIKERPKWRNWQTHQIQVLALERELMLRAPNGALN